MQERPSRHPATWIATAAVLGLAGWVFARSGLDHVERFAIGDAMAYLRVSWSIANGSGSTYDGLQPTNGYHPLWMWLHVPLMRGATSPMERLAAARALWGLTTLAATAAWAWLAWRATARALPAALVAMGIGATGWTVYVLDSGMETPVALLTLALGFLAVDRAAAAPSLLRGALAGLALGAALLARLDAGLLLVPLGLWCAWHLRFHRAALGALLISGTAAVAPYFWWNLQNFGGLQPVSGQVKTRASALDPTPWLAWWRGQAALLERVGLPPGPTLAVALLVAALLAAPGLRRLLWGEPAQRTPSLRLLPLGAALHYAYYALRIYEIHVPWHVFTEVAALVVLGALAVDFGARRAGLGVRGEAALAGVLAVTLFATDLLYVRMKSVRRGEVRLHLEIARHLAEQPPGRRVLMYDSWFVGALAHEQHLVDMSGLIGDATTARHAKDRAYDAMIERFELDSVVLVAPSTCAEVGPAVRWTSPEITSLDTRRAWVVDARAFVAAWRALSPETRATHWTLELRDALVCAAPAEARPDAH